MKTKTVLLKIQEEMEITMILLQLFTFENNRLSETEKKQAETNIEQNASEIKDSILEAKIRREDH